MTNYIYDGDLPDGLDLGCSVAIDTETTGLSMMRDRLCLAQFSVGDGNAHLVRFGRGNINCPNIIRLLTDTSIVKIFHYARYDVAMFRKTLSVSTSPVFCTKIASRLVRTYTDRHGLKELVREFLGVELQKEAQSSDWAFDNLGKEQMEYAANDVLHLHKLKERLEMMLKREQREHIAKACFDFLPVRAELDLGGWGEQDIFSH